MLGYKREKRRYERRQFRKAGGRAHYRQKAKPRPTAPLKGKQQRLRLPEPSPSCCAVCALANNVL